MAAASAFTPALKYQNIRKPSSYVLIRYDPARSAIIPPIPWAALIPLQHRGVSYLSLELDFDVEIQEHCSVWKDVAAKITGNEAEDKDHLDEC